MLLVSSCGDNADPTDTPQVPDTGGGNSGESNVYINSSELFIMESYPIQVSLHISGDLPTPCHDLVTTIEDSDDQNRIMVEISSEAEEDAICVQVLDPFDENIGIPLQDFADGDYEVWLNGELVGGFTYPGG